MTIPKALSRTEIVDFFKALEPHLKLTAPVGNEASGFEDRCIHPGNDCSAGAPGHHQQPFRRRGRVGAQRDPDLTGPDTADHARAPISAPSPHLDGHGGVEKIAQAPESDAATLLQQRLHVRDRFVRPERAQARLRDRSDR